MVDWDKLKDDLIRDEGLKNTAYTDSEGVITIGIGRNIGTRPLSKTEIDYLFENDTGWVRVELDNNAKWWRDLPEAPARALVNMCFNLGWPRLSKFKNMLASLKSGDFNAAANHALDSRWATQVGARATRVSDLMREG